LIDLAQDFAAHIRLGGKLILSGLLVTQVQDILRQYEKYALTLEHREDIGEWSALTLQKRG
jgi:ribosomal protein L11 methyltransferase